MKTSKVLATLMLLSLLMVNHSEAQPAAEQQILNLSGQKFGWMQRMQFDSLESVLDDRLMFIHSNGWTESKAELIQDLKSGKLKYVNIDVSEASARVYQQTAIVTGKGIFTVVLDGKNLSISLYYTEVYVLRNNKWLLASRHSNRLP